MKETVSLLIMVGGASSRMKRSLKDSSITEELKKQAQAVHKSLIPLGVNQHPLLYYLINNAVAVGYTNIYLITSPENKAFHDQLAYWKQRQIFNDVNIRFALQHVPSDKARNQCF